MSSTCENKCTSPPTSPKDSSADQEHWDKLLEAFKQDAAKEEESVKEFGVTMEQEPKQRGEK